MKLSTRARYGLRAMLELAKRDTTSPVMMRSIAAEQGLSKRYLDNIFATLRQAGLVHSVRGASGGYRLARTADDIFALDVIEALEGDLSLVACREEFGGDCDRYGHCATSELWSNASIAMRAVFSDATLGSLAARQAVLDSEGLAAAEPEA
jgi:Rrf2 family transcriptional regulator, cysteine metabolism repressor